MGDKFGALALPPGSPATGEAAGDPCLSRLGAYLMAWLNVEALTGFRAVFPATGLANVVGRVFTHDPQQLAFNEKDLPALYLFRTGGEPVERLAEDYDITHDVVQLYWVYPAAAQETNRLRRPMAAAIHKSIYHAIETGRHPSYMLAGDTDPTAASRGSIIYNAAGLFAIDVGAWDMGKLSIAVKGGDARNYDRVGVKLNIQELRTLDIVADYAALGGLDVTIKNSDGTRTLAVGAT